MLRDDRAEEPRGEPSALNVFGEPLDACSITPMTGFYRDGCCNTGPEDVGSHTVCMIATAEFLTFSKSRGNDLSTPVPAVGFPPVSSPETAGACARRAGRKLSKPVKPHAWCCAPHTKKRSTTARSLISSASQSTWRNRLAAQASPSLT
jgi:uncharacterized protein (DUF2237 family)